MKWERSHASKEDIITALQKLAEDLDKSPTWIECMKLSDIPLSRLTFHFGTLNKALIAAALPVNRKRAKKSKGYTRRGGARSKHRIHPPVFTLRVCNMCERKFQAEDDMRSCPVCAITKRTADNRGGFVDTDFGFSYFS